MRTKSFVSPWKASAAVVGSSIHGCPANLKDSLICWNLPGNGRRKTCIGFWRANTDGVRWIRELMTPPESKKRKIGFLVKERAACYGKNIKLSFRRFGNSKERDTNRVRV